MTDLGEEGDESRGCRRRRVLLVNGFWCHGGCYVVVIGLLCGGGVVERVVAV